MTSALPTLSLLEKAENEIGRPCKIGRPWHFEISQPLIYYISSCVRILREQGFIEIAFG